VAIKLYRCKNLWVKAGGHPCWRVQKALDEAGIAYEVVKEPLRRSKREETMAKTGQNLYPWIELEDGTVVHAYKHIWTRHYVHATADGRVFEYRRPGRYREVDASQALLLAFFTWEPDEADEREALEELLERSAT